MTKPLVDDVAMEKDVEQQMSDPPPYVVVDGRRPVGPTGTVFSPPSALNQNAAYPHAVYPGPGQYIPGQYAPGQYNQPGGLQYVVTQPPSDHMAFAVLVTIFCFWPFGIAAMRRSRACRLAIAMGDLENAEARSAETKTFASWGVVLGIVCYVVVIVLVVVRITAYQ